MVTTLSLMVLLVIMAIGLLTLSTISLRSSASGRADAEARANARMAMILAIGELQKSLGGDGAITAPSAMLDSNPDTPGIDGVSEPHLTGVWAARQDSLGGQPDYNRATPFRRWLLSTGSPEAAQRLDLAQSNTLVDPVTLARAATPGGGVVRAGRVRTKSGTYAWWVGDENCKAHVGGRDNADRRVSSDIAELLAGMATPGSHGIRALGGFEKFPSNTETSDKVATHALIKLANSTPTPLADHFHDLSPYSASVLADVTKGALRQDLSMYLERRDINWLEGWGWPEGKNTLPAGPLGPNGQIALSNPIDYDVLSWKSLHHWYNMHRRQLSTNSNLQLTAMRNYVANDPVSNPTWNSGVLRIWPVLARMQMIVSYGVQKTGTSGGSSTYKIFMYSYPVLTLWNPYSVGLRVEQWSMMLHTLPLEHSLYQNASKINLTGSGTRNGNYNWGWPSGNMVMRFGDAGTPGITFAPGEAKTLTYISSTSNDFNSHNMVASLQPWLPPSPSNPLGRAGQVREIGTITGQDGDRLEIQTAGSSWHTSANSYDNFQTTFIFRTESKAVHRGHPDELRKQMFTSQVAWRCEADAGNPIPDVISRSNFPSMTLGQLNGTAVPFLHLDVRLKTLDEVALPNKTWLHNIPQHPYAAATSTQKHSNVGVDAATTFFAHPYTLAFEQINGIEGLIQNRPFFGPSNRPAGRGTIVAQDIPLAPLTSLAQLQNLPQVPIEALNSSGHYLQNQAIGNSYASPGLAPQAIKQRSFPFYLGEYFAWQGGDNTGKFYSDPTWFNNAEYTIQSAPASVIDRSYAANHLLFDSYFFSSLAGQTGAIYKNYGKEREARQVLQEFFDGTRPAPNPAYQPYLAQTTAATLTGTLAPGALGIAADAHRRVAAHLMVTGGFNVNSTSVPAWTALLASAHLKRPVTITGGTLKAQNRARFVVSRFSAPVGGAADDSLSSEDNRWLGYRELSALEVRQLAEAIVKQVKKRGPFRSLGEFVNRRLTSTTTETELARYGALQAALEDPSVTINASYRDKKISAADLSGKYAANYKFPEAALGSRYQGTPAYISQADILTPIAPILNARSDTFLVRGYGESLAADGKTILARAWCEAVVQRMPDFIDSLDAPHTLQADLKSNANKTFGRRFQIKSFRWLSPVELQSTPSIP